MKVTKKQILKFRKAANRNAFVKEGGYDGRFGTRIVRSRKQYDRVSEKRNWKKSSSY